MACAAGVADGHRRALGGALHLREKRPWTPDMTRERETTAGDYPPQLCLLLRRTGAEHVSKSRPQGADDEQRAWGAEASDRL